MTRQQWDAYTPAPSTPEECLDRAVETAVPQAIFGGNEMARRRFFQLAGASSATAPIRTVFPLDTAKAMAQEHVKGIEKKDLTVSFIPITCATPIIKSCSWMSPLRRSTPSRAASSRKSWSVCGV